MGGRGFAGGSHAAPPLVVRRMVAPSPTRRPWVVLAKAMPKSGEPPDPWTVQFAPPSPEWRMSAKSPTAHRSAPPNLSSAATDSSRPVLLATLLESTLHVSPPSVVRATPPPYATA